MRNLAPKNGRASEKRGATALTPEMTEEVLRMVRAEVGRSMLNTARTLLGETDHLTTQGGDRHAPPQYQGRAKKWRADAPTIPGAVKVGRWWTVSRAAYAAWIESQRTTPAPGPVAAPVPARPWTPEDALIGLRAVGGGR